jgi:hypothetical protein
MYDVRCSIFGLLGLLVGGVILPFIENRKSNIVYPNIEHRKSNIVYPNIENRKSNIVYPNIEHRKSFIADNAQQRPRRTRRNFHIYIIAFLRISFWENNHFIFISSPTMVVCILFRFTFNQYLIYFTHIS